MLLNKSGGYVVMKLIWTFFQIGMVIVLLYYSQAMLMFLKDRAYTQLSHHARRSTGIKFAARDSSGF